MFTLIFINNFIFFLNKNFCFINSILIPGGNVLGKTFVIKSKFAFSNKEAAVSNNEEYNKGLSPHTLKKASHLYLLNVK